MNAPRGLTTDRDAGAGCVGDDIAIDVEDGNDASARWQPLWQQLQGWAAALGFSQIAVADVKLGAAAERGLADWLAQGCHGDMQYMAAHGARRARPAELRPGTLRVITARMDYLPRAAPAPQAPPATSAAHPDSRVARAASGPFAPAAPPATAAAHAASRLSAAQPTLPVSAVDANGGPAASSPSAASSTHGDCDPPADWRAVEWSRLADPAQATVSVYARGRDYHKVMRGRLQALADRLAGAIGPFGHRVFTDSAPVMEVELATRSGIGWRGKHTLALHREAGSMFFLGEIFVDLPLPLTPPLAAHEGSCGSCSACIDVCPTRAIVGAQRLDARRCISYLTIEHAGPIPLELRPLIGNRIYGCDDCQLICPWNKYAQRSALPDFDVRAPLGGATLLQLWQWDEAAFLHHTEGSAIRRIGFERWRRNLAVALGNLRRERAGADPADLDAAAATAALGAARAGASPLLREHIEWALAQRHGAC